MPPDLAEYKTVDTARTTTLKTAVENAVGLSGYLGVEVEAGPDGRVVLADVAEHSPAQAAGLQKGDVLLRLEGQAIARAAELRTLLLTRAPGEVITLGLERAGQPQEVPVTLAATSRPKKLAERRAVLGLTMATTEIEEGIPITRILSGSPADKAGLRAGDVLVKINDASLGIALSLNDALADKEPGVLVNITYRREGAERQTTAKLAAGASDNPPGGTPVSLPLWKKKVYRLALIPIEFPDAPHNAAIPPAEWEEMLFSRGTYANRNNATGQPVYGSMRDYYDEVSAGALRVEGRMFAWAQAGRKRGDYPLLPVNPKQALFTEVLDLLLEREGDDCLAGFDGLLFLYAGERFPTTNRGSIFWPHRASVTYRGKSWPYFICPEGGPRMNNISVFCHEFGHLLGLPDLYARPENPGSEGAGAWSLMSQQIGGGQPQHLCAWSKERLGWLQPAVLDPAVRQKLILSPVEGTSDQCFKIPIRMDGSEYLLLENRRRQGFDQRLPGEGLLIWHVVGKRPQLEESTGIEGPPGPLVYSPSIPYPSEANDSYTPYTTPSSRSQLGGGQPVHLTNIRRLPDGRITFYLGYEYD